VPGAASTNPNSLSQRRDTVDRHREIQLKLCARIILVTQGCPEWICLRDAETVDADGGMRAVQMTLHHCKIPFFVATGGKRASTGNVGQAAASKASRANRDGKPSKSRNVNVLRNGRPEGSFAGRFGFTLPPFTHFTNKTYSALSLFSLFL